MHVCLDPDIDDMQYVRISQLVNFHELDRVLKLKVLSSPSTRNEEYMYAKTSISISSKSPYLQCKTIW